MPSMYEIYDKHSFEYDELVSCEDYQGNLAGWFRKNIDFGGKSVVEFGAGTGRLTKMYASSAGNVCCYDRSSHMLARAEQNLAGFPGRIKFGICDNNEISKLAVKTDIIIEGWSFGHTVHDADDNHAASMKITADCISLLRSGGEIVFIETLGTNYENPVPANPALAVFYEVLEKDFGFKKEILRTDYRFGSNEEARRICGFFFGESFPARLKFSEKGVVREFTGIWSYKSC